MVLERILPYIVSALSLLASLSIFVSLKREMHRERRQYRKEMDEITHRLKRAEAIEPVSETSPPVFGAPLGSGFNPDRRVQALRLMHRGEGSNHIAAALGIPAREVELLIRVQRINAAYATAGQH